MNDLEPLKQAIADQAVRTDQLWVLVAAAMVMLMQAGFLALEVGSVRPQAAGITALKNVVDWVVCAVTFFFLGWGIMYGRSVEGIFGGDGFSLNTDGNGGNPIGIGVHFVFTLAFAGTAATIVSGAMAERTGFVPYIICSTVMTVLIYPVAGHWIWGRSFFASNDSLLASRGFVDFAGSTAVHAVGGWTSLVGIWVVGPRLGRFGPKGEVREVPAKSAAWTALGVLILWFCWWGFNGGSTLAVSGDIAPIIINTNIAAGCGAIAALAHCWVFQHGKEAVARFLQGVLAGLVAITAGCNIVSPLAAVAIGVSAGVVSNLGSTLLLRLRLDDPVGAVPVHLFCGIWGTLCVALFGDADLFPMGHSRVQQLGAQLEGIAVTGLWVAGVSLLMFRVLRRFLGLRVSPADELAGIPLLKDVEELGPEPPLAAELAEKASVAEPATSEVRTVPEFPEKKFPKLRAEPPLPDPMSRADFNEVAIQKLGGYVSLGVDEFLAMPLDQRIDLVSEGKVHFLKDGKVVAPFAAKAGPRGGSELP
jgi:Amt family ammonium transporter